jgi:hypothetical protein
MAQLRILSPNEFEDTIAAMFERLGFEVEQTPYVSDHGRDAIMYHDGNKILLECKRYGEETTSDRPQLQIFHSAIVSDRAAAGFFVTTGRVTSGAIEFAKNSSITIISGNSLRETYFNSLGSMAAPPTYSALCRECGEEITLNVSAQSSARCSRGHVVTAPITFENIAASIPKPGIRPPKCSKCGTPMRLVKGKRGKFWGCSRYPACRSTLPYQ